MLRGEIMDVELLADSAGEWEAVMADILADMAGEYEAVMAGLLADTGAGELLATLNDDHETFLDGLLIDHEKRYLISRVKGDGRKLGVGAGRSRGLKNKPLSFVGHGRRYKVTTG